MNYVYLDLKMINSIACKLCSKPALYFSMMHRSADTKKKSVYTSLILTQNDTIKALYSAQSALFLSHQHVKKQDASSAVGGGGDDDGSGLV